MDMLPFTDDIHKRSPSFTTICLKSDSTLVRSIAQFVIVGRCRTAGWNCFRMATVVRLSVELVMASVLRRTSPTERAAAVRSTRSLGSDMFTASRSACVFNGFISARLHIAYMLSELCAIARPSVCQMPSSVHTGSRWLVVSVVEFHAHVTIHRWYEKS